MTSQLSENSHQGFEGIKAGLCLGSTEVNSNTAVGMPVCLWRNGIRSRSTGKERDVETGLDYFEARYFSAPQGRFTSPDPSSNGIAVADPQSWNLYSYVRNRPTRFVDIGGEWATEIHEQITSFALRDYVSAGEMKSLIRWQYIMDNNYNGPNDQYMHAMSNGSINESAATATNRIMAYMADQSRYAKANLRADGSFSDASIIHLGMAIHTYQDMTSPVHMTPGGEPIAWNGYVSRTSGSHYLGENSPSDSWAGIGTAIRLSMAYFMETNPSQAQNHGLTPKTFEAEVRRSPLSRQKMTLNKVENLP
jgi:RHS repeat-associated protein